MNFITGEKIQFLCDHFVGKERDFKFNPKVKNYEAKKSTFLDILLSALYCK